MKFTLSEIATLEAHHCALVYVREDIPVGELVQELTSVEPISQLLYASTETWRNTLQLLEQMKGRPGGYTQ